MTTNTEKIELLEEDFEKVTQQLENLENDKSNLISNNKCTIEIDERIDNLESKQYDIQSQIEYLED